MLCSTESNYYSLKAGFKVIVFDDDTRSHIAELSAPRSSNSPPIPLKLKRNLTLILTSLVRYSHSDHFITLTQETENISVLFHNLLTVKRQHGYTLYVYENLDN